MQIQVKRWDGQGDPQDPKTGEPISGNSQSVYSILGGKVISGVGGVTASTESITINFQDGSALWFVTAGGPPRILLRSKP
jgi:hypothetical protein